MVEPLTIVASAASLLGICSKVAVELKRFRHGAAEARTYVTAMLNDMKGLRDVLQSMEDTFDEFEVQPSSGHIGIHWKNLLRSLQDGRSTLEQLEELLTTINKQVTFLDSARREVRVKSAVEQIANFRQQVQTYKDAMQLSLQTIILESWHQVSIQESTSKILPSLNAMHSDIRRLATNLDIKLHGLQNMFLGSNQQKQMAGVEHLKEFIHSAATVLSSASTITSNDKEGDDALSDRASKGVMPEVYVPTVFENYVCDVQAYGASVEVALWDTAGQEDYDRLRPLAYPDSHGVFICFAIDSPDSLDNAQEKVKYPWVNEVSHFCKDVPVFLLGCKNDLRDDPSTIGRLWKTSQCPVKPAEAEEVRRGLRAVEYFDCSAKTGDGVGVALEKAVRHVLQGETVQKKRRKGRSFF
ncbi:hypothetical protein CNMCM8980_006914 [Aspergillus fumigatiaffinis]|uniref:Fungal N-terminal domain-containing protein n=1 Tax=Aspergillus fumigatiaffinis TaxID=340414 RepID=A0A8H4GX60_9EURO|nr:hypothetical protein CNMCM5878_009563 [Aspergillus fumigatiaffinis]KAF4230542.1 hypothetical protein CNMCM6457_005887 [Aspergillus fumigatiaffinis]KAF4237784.1 hypothetical protein CNMCM6805_006841 [Aspergillus fumigatiaffinis]KAF4247846.1 hypothetical protein CNMCM8980_006914 [Aspergillus fumigatiaffinis]